MVTFYNAVLMTGSLVKDGLVVRIRRSVCPKVVNQVQDINAIVNEVDTIDKIVLPRTYKHEYLRARTPLKKKVKTG